MTSSIFNAKRVMPWAFIAISVLLMSGCAFGPSKEKLQQQARAQTAMSMWKERCDTKAGYKIYRRAENVDGIFLMKIRDGDINFDDQYKLDDPYGRDSRGDNYILNFLKGAYHQRTDQSYPPGSPPVRDSNSWKPLIPRMVFVIGIQGGKKWFGKRMSTIPTFKDCSKRIPILT